MSLEKGKIPEGRAASVELILRNVREAIGDLDGVDDFELPEIVKRMKERSAAAAFVFPPGYESLGKVLVAAVDQAAMGKGRERHAHPGESFDRQKICEITRRVGIGYPLGQAIKKAEESLRLGEAGPAELLGAINYLAAAHIVLSERPQ